MQLRVATVTAYCYARVLEKLPQQPGDTVILMWGSHEKACWEFSDTRHCAVLAGTNVSKEAGASVFRVKDRGGRLFYLLYIKVSHSRTHLSWLNKFRKQRAKRDFLLVAVKISRDVYVLDRFKISKFDNWIACAIYWQNLDVDDSRVRC